MYKYAIILFIKIVFAQPIPQPVVDPCFQSYTYYQICSPQIDNSGNPCYIVLQQLKQQLTQICTSSANPQGITQNACGQYSYCNDCNGQTDDLGNPCYWIGSSFNGYLCTNANYYRNVLCTPGTQAYDVLMCGGSLSNSTSSCSASNNPITITQIMYLIVFIIFVPHPFNLIAFYFYVYKYNNIVNKWLNILALIFPYWCWQFIEGYAQK